MEYTRFQVTGTELQRQPQASPPQLLTVRTAIIDKSHPQHPASLYCVKNGVEEEDYRFMDESAILFLGHVSFLCRETKRFYLIDDTIVAYHQLITLSGHLAEGCNGDEIRTAIVNVFKCQGITCVALADQSQLAAKPNDPLIATVLPTGITSADRQLGCIHH